MSTVKNVKPARPMAGVDYPFLCFGGRNHTWQLCKHEAERERCYCGARRATAQKPPVTPIS